jgi:transcriptional regulator with XRE-family HTH domain
MLTEVTPRKNLHDFLREARARIQPPDIGITPPANRRGGGLHQTDLATALGVSMRWYNGFENGAVTADEAMLDRIAQLLRLTPVERVHLYLLATGHEPPPGSVEPPAGAHAVLTQLVHQMGDMAIPALVTDIAWNVLAWNPALSTWFPDPASFPPHTRNLVVWAFTDDLEKYVRDPACFRSTYIGWVHLAAAGHPEDPRLGHLVSRLQGIPAARDLWNAQQIAEFTNSIVSMQFLLAGDPKPVDIDLVNLEFPGGYRLMLLIPRGARPAKAAPLRRLIPGRKVPPRPDPK